MLVNVLANQKILVNSGSKNTSLLSKCLKIVKWVVYNVVVHVYWTIQNYDLCPTVVSLSNISMGHTTTFYLQLCTKLTLLDVLSLKHIKALYSKIGATNSTKL